MNTAGLWLMGGVAGIWLLTNLLGLLLAWPRLWQRLAGWMAVLSARADRGAYQSNYRLHRAAGLWFLPVLLVLSFTSIYENLPQFVRPVVGVFSPLAVRPVGRPVAKDAPIVSPDQAVASLIRRFPSAHASSIGFDRRAGRYSIIFRLPDDLSTIGEQWAFVDLSTGEILGAKLTATSSAGDWFLSMIFPLHTGTAFGLPGRIVIACGGVCLIVLITTGFYVWWTKWRMRKRAHMMRKVVVATAAMLTVGLSVLQAQAPSTGFYVWWTK